MVTVSSAWTEKQTECVFMLCDKHTNLTFVYWCQYWRHFNLFTSLGFLTEPSLSFPFPSYHHRSSSVKLAFPVQSTGNGETISSPWAIRCVLSSHVYKPSSRVSNTEFNVIVSDYGTFRRYNPSDYSSILQTSVWEIADAVSTQTIVTYLLPSFSAWATWTVSNQRAMTFWQQHLAKCTFRETLTCLCLISSFFCSRKADGMPAMFSWALSRRGHRSLMNSRAFLPFKKPVRLICIILLSGCCNTHEGGREKTIRPFK